MRAIAYRLVVVAGVLLVLLVLGLAAAVWLYWLPASIVVDVSGTAGAEAIICYEADGLRQEETKTVPFKITTRARDFSFEVTSRETGELNVTVWVNGSWKLGGGMGGKPGSKAGKPGGFRGAVEGANALTGDRSRWIKAFRESAQND
jgi:hypothetical protein